MQQTLVVGNWKMHGTLRWSQAMAETLTSGLNGIGGKVCVAVCPTFLHLQAVGGVLQKSNNVISLGAQNVHAEQDGAHTGEISVKMLSDIGVRFVIVGHSERRVNIGEIDQEIAAKFKALKESELVPILCIGESADQRERKETETVVIAQLCAVISECGINALTNAVIAYEPIWAIGTGETASAEQAQGVHRCIRNYLSGLSTDVAESVRIIYGGSVNSSNAKKLFSQPDIDGSLIGGASLKSEEFISICKIAGY
jgi:triosephosphate isomerase